MFLKDEAATHALGVQLGQQAREGTVFALSGDLGAGKSSLARGIARGLGVEGRVPSPTFVILASYTGRLRFHHLDLYRLAGEDELEQLGLEDVLGTGVCVVEWPERAPGWFAEAVWIDLTEEGEGRRAVVRAPCP